MTTQNIDISINAKDNASKSIGKVSEIVKGLATYDFAKYVGKGLFSIGKNAVDLAAKLEQTKIAFTTMTGSARVADAFIREMTAFAKTTPFEIDQVETASKQLLAYWFAVQDVIPNLRMLGDISAGIGMDKLPNLIMAFGQVSAATRLTGNELRQFTEAWVPLLEELAKIMKKPASEIQNLVSKGQVGFPLVQQALMSLTKEGWRFENLMEKQSKSFGGMVSNFKDSLSIMLRDIGTQFLPQLKSILQDMLIFWDKNGKAIVVSFIGMINSILEVSKLGLSSVAQAFKLFATFVVGENAVASENAFSSWQNFFVFIQLLLADLRIAFYGLGAWLVRTFYEITYDIGIAFVALWGWIMKIIPRAVGLAVKSAIWSVDKLFQALSAIPWIEIKPLNDKLYSLVDAITDSMVSTKELDNALLWLVDWRNKALAETEAKAKTIARGIMGEVKTNYLEMLKAQNGASESWETLAKVLEEIGTKTKKITDGTKAAGWAGKNALDAMKELAEDTKKSMEWVFESLNSTISSQKNKIFELSAEYKKLGETLKKTSEEGAKALDEINKKLQKQSEIIADTARGWREDVAKRVVEAEKELKDLIDMANKPWYEWRTKEEYAKMEALKKEIELGQKYAGQQNIDTARIEAGKSETQLIIDRTAKRVEEETATRAEIQITFNEKKRQIDEETAKIREQMEIKKAEGKKEYDLYRTLIVQRTNIEKDYFALFQKNINDQISKTKEAITLMNTLAGKKWVGLSTTNIEGRANGWPINAWQPYMVWERWPEMIIPRSNGTVIPNGMGETNVNINMWGVTVNNRADADYMVDRIKRELTREMQLFKLWIA
jgi:tape measure domain-containing protein